MMKGEDEYDEFLKQAKITVNEYWIGWVTNKLAQHHITAHPIEGIVESLARALDGTDISPDQAMDNLIDNLKEMHRRETGEEIE
jgi:hypothetical protein